MEKQLRQSHSELGYEILLPLAISFYTFQIMSYGFDLKNKIYVKKHSLAEFLLFVSFFPQLIAGPIVRSQDLLPQMQLLKEGILPIPNFSQIKAGLWLLVSGVIKKIFIANQLLLNIQPLLLPESPSVFEIPPISFWILSLSFLVMLYADFSGYSDIARGLGKLLGFELPINFKAPFFFSSFSDLWKRWHLTFSSWIRDYIFIPLGGSRGSEWLVCRNIFITFLFGGIWHGAGVHFVVWGIWHSAMLIIERQYAKTKLREILNTKGGLLYLSFSRVFTLICIAISVPLFRSNSMTEVVIMFEKMFYVTTTSVKPILFLNYSKLILLLFVTAQIFEKYKLKKMLGGYKSFTIFLLVNFILLLCFGVKDPKSFIYFAF